MTTVLVGIYKAILFWVVSIIAFNTSVQAEPRFEIDDEGNIILVDEDKNKKAPPEKKIQETPQAPEVSPSKPIPSQRIPVPAPRQDSRSPNPSPSEVLKERAIITAKLVPLKREESSESQTTAMLKRGDSVEVVERTGSHAKVRFLIDGFPIEGWLPLDALQLTKSSVPKNLNAFDQKYEPRPREEKPDQLAELPSEALPEVVEGPHIKQEDLRSFPDPKIIPYTAKNDLDPFESIKRPQNSRTKNWRLSLISSVGWTSYEEKVSTQIDGVGAGVPFVSTELTGPTISAGLDYLHDFDQFNAGARLEYGLSIFDTDAGGPGTSITASSLQAQLHNIRLTGHISKFWQFSRFGIEPRFELINSFEIFNTNALRETPDTFPVLFNHWANSIEVGLSPLFYLPYEFQVEPRVGLVLFYFFGESPTRQYEEGYLGTGNASNSYFDFHYGGQIAWNCRRLGSDAISLTAGAHIYNYTRKYSGVGNRAAIETENAEAKVERLDLNFGVQYRF